MGRLRELRARADPFSRRMRGGGGRAEGNVILPPFAPRTRFKATGNAVTEFHCPECGHAFAPAAASDEAMPCPKCGASVPPPLPDEVEEIGSADELLEEVAPQPKRTPPRRTAVRSASRAPVAKPKPNRLPLVLVIAGAIAAGAIIVVTQKKGASPDVPEVPSASAPKDAGGAAPANVPAPSSAPATPAAELATRRKALAIGDVAGRLELADYCRDHELPDERGELLREVLLLDADNAAARRAFGFAQYAKPESPWKGRWLTKAEQQVADAFETVSGR